jgi:aminoglycoside phosphotransferase (APT) family kinase protein
VGGELTPEIVGHGRACDVLADGTGRVRRRYRVAPAGGTAAEFAVMRHLHRHGFPVPAVFEHDATDVVMERVGGTTMTERLAARPWELRHLASVLAGLHARLAAVPVDGLEMPSPFGAPTSVLHLDLHPGNVILSPGGPVVIDWTNACLGPAALDVATTWVIMATSDVEVPTWIRPVLGLVRGRFVARFVDLAGRDTARGMLRVAGERRIADPHVTPREAARVRELMVATARHLAEPA